MKKQKGFTLLELLVVIGIIAILVTIALALFGNARNRARDTAAMATLEQVRKQIELDDYSSIKICPHMVPTSSWTKTAELIFSAEQQVGCELPDCSAKCMATYGPGIQPPPQNPFTGWAVSLVLTDGITEFCVDSSGFIGTGKYATYKPGPDPDNECVDQ